MWKLPCAAFLGFWLAAGLSLPASADKVQPTAAHKHSTDPMDWIIQHVCADASDHPVAADPYNGCPSGTKERRLQIGDPLPYLRHDQPRPNRPHGVQRHDAYPIHDYRYGGTVAANDFDFGESYGTMEPGRGDGYDLYRIIDGWVSVGDTRDGGSFSMSFFGAACKPYNGWVFFPTSFLKSLTPNASGETTLPIAGSSWEHDGEPWPGSCTPGRTGFSERTLTTWVYQPSFAFGGMDGAPTKTIDAIVSTHGFIVGARPNAKFHLERFYFTDLYGVTRWEAWAPQAEGKPAGGNCNGPADMVYQGVEFSRTDCRDWTVTEINKAPKPHFAWPYPEANVLKNYHFDHDDMEPWRQSGGPGSSQMSWSQRRSSAPTDMGRFLNHPGVRYLAVDCVDSPCGPSSAIYQDVPVADLPRSGSYDYGFSGVVQDSSGGSVKVTLSERDAAGHELWTTSFDAKVSSEFRGFTPSESVYKSSSTFLNTSPVVVLKPNAAYVRFAISPQISGHYLFLDTWLMPR
jgi:hypothetical protein